MLHPNDRDRPSSHFLGEMRSRVQRLLTARSAGRFLIVGSVNTLVGFAAFPILYWLFISQVGINTLLATSYISCTLFAFWLHKIFTFESRGRAHIEGPKYFALSGLTFFLNLLLLNGLLRVTSFHPIVLQMGIAIALQLGNYLIMNHLIFVSADAASGTKERSKKDKS